MRNTQKIALSLQRYDRSLQNSSYLCRAHFRSAKLLKISIFKIEDGEDTEIFAYLR